MKGKKGPRASDRPGFAINRLGPIHRQPKGTNQVETDLTEFRVVVGACGAGKIEIGIDWHKKAFTIVAFLH